MNQTGSRQLSPRDRLLAVLGILLLVLLVVFLYRPVPPRPVYEDLGELSPLPDSFAVYQERETGDAFALYDAGQYDRFVSELSPESIDLDEGKRLYLGSAQLLAGRLNDAVYTLRQVITSEDSLLAAEARWQLAQAYLRSEQAEPARDELEHLASRRGHRAFDAAQKLSVLKTRLPRSARSP